MQTGHPPTVLAGRYALEVELGRSGTGMVWRARDQLLERIVTVKLVHPALADDPAFAARLAEEARRVASLTAPGVARLLDSGEEDGVPFLVREHVDGTSARARLQASGPLPADAATRIAIAALEALVPVHEAGLFHLHLELDDVLLATDGSVRVTDLGIGPAVTASRPPSDAARLLEGTGLAPEQATGAGVDARADVFAVGAALFELLAGEPPAGRRSPRAVRPGVPRALDRVVARALAPDPVERYPTATAFAAALREILSASAVAAPSRRGWLRTWLAVPVAVVAVAAAVIGAGIWLGRLEVGGPLGIRAADDDGAPAEGTGAVVRTIRPVSASAFDPFGDRHENDDDAALAIDGDAATAWRTENYFDDTLNNKPGIGLLVDLGESRRVTGFVLSTPHPGYSFGVAVGDDPEALVDAVAGSFTAEAETSGDLAATGRYVLVWITSVVPVPDGNRAEVSELTLVVADA